MPPGYWIVTFVSQASTIPLIAYWARRRGGTSPAWTLGIAAILVAWLSAALSLAAVGVFLPVEGAPPFIGVAVALPVALGAFFLLRGEARAAEASLPMLMGLQVLRVVGFEFVIASRDGFLPVRFGGPAGWGDALIGVTAPLVALAFARRWRGARVLATAWNLAGIADLVNAVALGVTSAPGLLRVFESGPSTELMTRLPLSLVPTFGVPLAVLGHLVALRALRAGVARGEIRENAKTRTGDAMTEKRVAVVTGVSSGIGEATARALVRDRSA